MMTRSRSAAAVLLVCGLGVSAGTAASQEAQSVKLGEAALRFAAGSIRQTMPQDGIVNFITGDNQTTGNRMILGWRGSDVLYLKLDRPGDASPGDLYTVYRRVRKVFHPATKRYLGYVVNMLAVVRVTQVDDSLATVQIVRSFAPLSPGDPVMRFVPPGTEDQAQGQEPRAQMERDGTIVDLQADKNMTLVGQGNLVYLDRGRGDGIRPGDQLEVNRLGGGLPRRKVAEIKILSTEESTATAVITKSKSRVLVGDRVRYASLGMSDGPHSDQGAEDGSLLAATEPEVTTSSSVDKPGMNVRTTPVAEGTRIDLEDLVEQLEYDSGEVKVKASGLPILEKIAEFLRSAASEKPIRVEGHADNMEIGPSLRSAFPSNWELSRARAAGIVRYLVEKGGLDSAKLTAVGYGATRPVASNATEEGRKRNRRVEIVVLATGLSHEAESITRSGDGMDSKNPADATSAAVPPTTKDQTQLAGSSASPLAITADPAGDHAAPAMPAPPAAVAPTDVAGDHSGPSPSQ